MCLSYFSVKSNLFFRYCFEIVTSLKALSVAANDIRYRNFGDGDPNNPLISTDYDRRVLGSSLPHFNYGGSVDLAWRGIDFTLTFQGVGQRNSYLTDEMVQPLRGQWYNFATYIGGGEFVEP